MSEIKKVSVAGMKLTPTAVVLVARRLSAHGERAAWCGTQMPPNAAMEVLAVRRRDGSYGLPGGKIDAGETPADAVAREVSEETGLVVEGLRQEALMTAEDGVLVAVFSGRVKGALRAAPGEVTPCWVAPGKVTSSRTSKFAAFNKLALKSAKEVF